VKLVIDTNTLISGSFWHGPPAQLLEAVAQGKVVLVLSAEILVEFGQVAARSKFAARVAAKGTTAIRLARKLAEEVTIVSQAMLPLPPELRDPKDLPVLACAVAAQADAIVSGDEDLLILGSFQGIPVITPREALEKLGLAGD